MTYEEASKAFGDEVPDLSLGALELAKKAVEKQIPKKPIRCLATTPVKRWALFGVAL